MLKFFKETMKGEIGELMSSSRLDRKWITVGPVRVYVRNGMRSLDGQIVPTIEIANIGVDQRNRRKGFFRAVCEVAEELATERGRYVYHENAAPELHAFHTGRGYLPTGVPLALSFYKNFSTDGSSK